MMHIGKKIRNGYFQEKPDEMPSIDSIFKIKSKRDRTETLNALREINFISEPIKFETNIKEVFRWDSRLPGVILTEGFNGAGRLYFNSIFGRKTVFTAASISGSEAFFNELSSGVFNNIESGMFYLYRIICDGLPAVPVKGEFGFAKQLATRDPWWRYDKDHIEYGLPPICHVTKASIYLDKVASENHEVQVCGPISPDRITFMTQRMLFKAR